MPLTLPQGALIHQLMPDGLWLSQGEDRLKLLTEWVHANLDHFRHATILDLGSNCGHFPIEYVKAGAQSVTMVEGRQKFLDIYDELVRAFCDPYIHGLDHPFSQKILPIKADVRDFEPVGSVNIVSCLGLIYHVEGIWKALAHILKVTQPKIILIESEIYPETFLKKEYGDAGGDQSKSLREELVLRPSAKDIGLEMCQLGYHPTLVPLGGLYETMRGFFYGRRIGS